MRGVVTLAGDGSQMLPWARGLRKEFLPLFDVPKERASEPVLKPVAHLALETLAAAGVTDLALVVRPENLDFVRGYFTVDPDLLRRHAHQPDRIRETRHIDRALGRLHLRFRLQRLPIGFGDAVRRAEAVIGNEPFVVHSGDAVILEAERGAMLRRMIALRRREHLDAVLLVRRVADARRYGVVEGKRCEPFEGVARLEVERMEEKPARPRSHWAATAVYVFGPAIWPALRRAARRAASEVELTSGITGLLEGGGRVGALVLSAARGQWRSVGSPDRYLRALVETELRSRRSIRRSRRR
ncbi:MAG: sugar phosphate nucleotidyltransferase [Thermoplasmata archaeon]